MSSGLRVGFQALVDVPVRVFGFTKTPPASHTEIISLLAPYTQDGLKLVKSASRMAGFKAIPEAGVLIFDPSPNQVATPISALQFPSGGASDWHDQKDSTTNLTAAVMTNSSINNTFDAATISNNPANAGFFARIGRGQPAPGASIDSSTYWCQLSVGDMTDPDGAGATPFRLVLQYGQPPFLQQGIDNGDGTWFWGAFGENGVIGSNIQDCAKLFENSARVVDIQWHTFPDQNTVVVYIGNGLETLVYRPANTQVISSIPGIVRRYTGNVNLIEGPVRLSGQNGWAQFQYLGMQFATSGQFYSGEIDLQFVYQGNGGVSLGNSLIPSGYTVTSNVFPADYTGTRVQYYFEIDSNESAPIYLSPLINYIQLSIPPTFDYTATVGSVVDISSRIAHVQERLVTDYQNGLIRTQVGITFDNTTGLFSTFAGQHRAVQFSRWLEYTDNLGLMQPLSAPITLLTGWTGHKGRPFKADPYRQFDCVFDDNLWTLSRQQCEILDPGDGWCCLAYMHYVMNMKGVNDDFIADTFKTCGFGPNPPDCPHLKLPLGTGVNPRVVPSPELKSLSWLSELNDILFSFMWSDPNGIIQIMPYYPGIYQTPFKGTFRTGESSGDPTSSDFLSSMWHQQMLRMDTDDVRTGVAFYGLDPATNMPQGTYLNIDDLYPGYTAAVHGFRENYVKISNRFVDPDFTAAYAEAALARVVLPNVWEQHDACFLPNLFCLDQYNVDEDNELISGIVPLIAEQITSNYHSTDPQVMGSTILGRWAYNLL